MLTMNDLVDLRMQQQIAHELYRQQIMQRIPDPFTSMLPLHMPHHIIVPPRPTLPGVEAKLENNDLWKQFHKIGTEMIITKSGRRMFPSMRVSLSGLDEEANYCVLLEMVPIGDCRYKFSGSHWIPAGGAEPQSPQRMFLHPDSPATGAHWQSQAILFNKVKLTNNTLDSNGHIVLASMHKYQPRLHIIRTSDLSQLPWAPQQAFVFPETEYVAVTAYQNDRITKLKIDNNPFAKGFRETGQSRCKRKLSTLTEEQDVEQPGSPGKSEDDRASVHSNSTYESCTPQRPKRVRSDGSYDDDSVGIYSASSSCGSISPRGFDEAIYSALSMYHRQQQQQHQQFLGPQVALDLAAAGYLAAAPPMMMQMPTPAMAVQHQLHHQQQLQQQQQQQLMAPIPQMPAHLAEPNATVPPTPTATAAPASATPSTKATSTAQSKNAAAQPTPSKRNNFSISAILAY